MDKTRPGASQADHGPSQPTEPTRVVGARAARPRARSRAKGGRGYLDGQMLIAMPGIGDPRFERAVLMVCAHDNAQAMGIVLNRPLDGLTVPGLLQKLGMDADSVPPSSVLSGGPVERVKGFVVHSDDYAGDVSTVPVCDGVSLTDTRDVLDAIGDEMRRPRRWVLALGYAGWGPGQLENELREGVWLTCEPDDGLVFDHDYDGKWTRALAKIGVTADRLSPEAGRA